LHRITRVYGKPEQLQEYLEDSNLGPESSVAKGEWDLWRLRLKSMEVSQKWVELFEITSTLLKRARTKNASSQLAESKLSDWVVWEGFIRSAVELPTYRYCLISRYTSCVY
jgi:N-terminal acetyltransferase B complex non-catalytic subunit